MSFSCSIACLVPILAGVSADSLSKAAADDAIDASCIIALREEAPIAGMMFLRQYHPHRCQIIGEPIDRRTIGT